MAPIVIPGSMSARSVGVAVGLVITALSIVGNLWRGDPHLVSTVPNLLTALVMAAVTFLGVYGAVTQEPATPGAGQIVTRAASGVFAAGLGTFTLIYLHTLILAGFAALTGFVTVFVLGFVSSVVVGRFLRRAMS